ncbi:LolA family protein [Sporosarcina beigongshangi]|uniref:LolA family protein n=1 Tax=Sporosarcina beigongshangi TaxID=2782538 RepID=UPI00193AABC3|nr:sigma-E factor regulatory protein RseB domain-containing protein [Sporosarcina beigongshangi]
MSKHEQQLSEYIDRLNTEQKPIDHDTISESVEIEELYSTVQRIRSLKEPAEPNSDYEKMLVQQVENELSRQKRLPRKKGMLFTGIASIAAILAILFNMFSPFTNSDIVNAMEVAFDDVKAYHGFLEIIATNANEESTMQAKLEVWANRDGHYVVKGLEGINQDIVTGNNGKTKWQVNPNEKQVHRFPAFPDTYHFAFELGHEVKAVTNALSTKVIGDDTVIGRKASIVEVTPQGGQPYRIWIDKETKLPLQKQTAMHNALQYTITFTDIDFNETIPEELLSYQVPKGYQEVETSPEQIVNSLNEIPSAIGYIPEMPKTISEGYDQNYMTIIPNQGLVKIYYTSQHNDNKIVFIQGQAVSPFTPVRTATLGKVNGKVAEIQSPIYEDVGILGGGGLYAGMTDVSSIRWQQNGFEYVVIGNAALEEHAAFVNSLTSDAFEMPSTTADSGTTPQFDVPYDMTIEENTQKSVDAGSSPWRLDPVAVAQVFVSLQISPDGIVGDYPIDLQDFNVLTQSDAEVVLEVSSDQTPITTIYLKRLIRPDSTGIWTVVGYD